MSRQANAGTGILSVWNEYPSDDVDFYERWYMGEHFPERLGVPGFLRGRRYRAIEADRTYFTVYDLETPDVLFSQPYIARLNDPTAWTRRIMSRWSAMFRTECRRLSRSGTAVGGFVVAARFEGAAEISRGQAAELHRKFDDPEVVAVDLWEATAERGVETKEANARARPDGRISAAVIVEATSEAAARRASERLLALLGPEAVPSAVGLYALIALQDAPSTQQA